MMRERLFARATESLTGIASSAMRIYKGGASKRVSRFIDRRDACPTIF
jgi:hypothetical protein